MPTLSISMLDNLLKSNPRAKTVGGFGAPMRTGQRSSFEDGDILVFPTLLLKEDQLLLETKEGNKKVYKEFVVEEPMMQNGAIVTRPNANGEEEEVSLHYCILDVERGSTKAYCRFYPSIFWKARTEAIQEGKGVWKRGKRKISDGDVINFVQQYGTVDEAMVALSGKKAKVEIHEFKSVPFGTARDAPFEPEDDYVATLTFC